MVLSARQISRAPHCGAKSAPRTDITRRSRLVRVTDLCAMGREARLICRAPEVFMQWQSRQQLKFQALLAERAHFLRHNLTENERILWRRISGKQLGVAFRRQVPVGKYIADFVAPSAGLIVEVDDRSHELRRVADARRDRNLARLGYRVLRLSAELVRGNVEEAVDLVSLALRKST
jgi:very-short-patch-repair endonuclease